MPNKSVKKTIEGKIREMPLSQLKILKELTVKKISTTKLLSGATIAPLSEIKGRLGTLSRENLIKKAGREDTGDLRWILNEQEVDKNELKTLLEEIGL